MNVLIVDTTSARAHAEAWLANESPHTNRLWTTQRSDLVQNIADLAIDKSGEHLLHTDPEGVAEFARNNNIDLAIVSQEDALLAGTSDALTEYGIAVFGPSQKAAEVETSKVFSKELMVKTGQPTADFVVCKTYDEAIKYATPRATFENPLYSKRDRPARGKGVDKITCLDDLHKALMPITDIENDFSLTQRVILEKGLVGFEIGLHAWVNGRDYVMYPFAMVDHKTVDENDEGSMTGGMGVVAPAPGIAVDDIEKLGRQFVAPTINELYESGRSFTGVLYSGLILTAEGPMKLEDNARPGDPETQVWAPLLDTDKSDFIEIALACSQDRLSELPEIHWRKAASTCLILAARGYPDATEAGQVITGLKDIDDNLARVFDYGTRIDEEGNYIANAGRSLSVGRTAYKGESLEVVLEENYEAASRIKFDGERPVMRGDVGKKVLSTEFKQRVKDTRHLF